VRAKESVLFLAASTPFIDSNFPVLIDIDERRGGINHGIPDLRNVSTIPWAEGGGRGSVRGEYSSSGGEPVSMCSIQWGRVWTAVGSEKSVSEGCFVH
jgi:hypothetical protein